MAGPSVAVKLKAILNELARVPANVSQRGAAFITAKWKQTYAAGQDPYGKGWAPLAASTIDRKGHGRILQETGETLEQTRARPMAGAGIRLVTGPRAEYHLEATSNRPARPVLPLRGLPPVWQQGLKRIAIEEARKAVKRRG